MAATASAEASSGVSSGRLYIALVTPFSCPMAHPACADALSGHDANYGEDSEDERSDH